MSEDLRERVVKRHQDRYADFGPTLACEKLATEGLVVSPNTLTALLKARGLWARAKTKKAVVNNRRYKPAATHAQA